MSTKEKGTWKYCYWLDDSALSKIKKQMEENGIKMVQAERNPCEALKDEIGYAEPHKWGTICKHDAKPWYNASKHAGENLVVSSFPLDEEYRSFLATTIEQTSFEPEEFPSKEDLMKLAKDETYLSCDLEGWGAFPKEMGEAMVKGLTKMTGKPFDKFEDLLSSWDAVHSNFVNPKYRAGEEYMNAPYTVTDSTHTGTCCVELFNLLDTKEDAMLVRPCIGGVIVKVLEKDRYYLVRPAK